MLGEAVQQRLCKTPHLDIVNRWYEAFNSGVARMIEFRYLILRLKTRA